MPRWEPILASPFVGLFSWYLAYAVVRPSAVDGGWGDTDYAWLPAMTVLPGLLWLVAVAVVLFARAVARTEPESSGSGVYFAAVSVNVLAVLIIFGTTASTRDTGDAWPSDGSSLVVLVIGAALSLVPTLFLVSAEQKRKRAQRAQWEDEQMDKAGADA